VTAPDPRPCRSCKALVYWAITRATGRAMPVDVDPHGNGNLVLSVSQTTGQLTADSYDEAKHAGRNRFRSHFASCRQAEQWRR
jgi:hypothetical protein